MSGLERTPRTRIWAFGGGLFLLLSLAHGLYLQQPGLAGGPLLFLDNLFTLLFSFSFLALATALGLGVLSRTRLDGLSDTDTLAFSLALGSGVLATGILILGSVGGFHLPWLFLLLLAGVWVGRANLGRLPDLGLGAAKETAEVAGRPALLVFAAVAVAMILLAVAPPTDYDSLMYHLEGPAQFLERGGIYLPDGNFHVAYVGLAHMLYIPALAFGAPSTPAVLSTLFALALGFLVLRVTSNVFTVAEARLGLVLLWGSPILMLVAATPKVDVTLAFFLLAGHYALLNALYQPPRVGKWMALSGLVLGLAVGVKYLALVYVAALSPLVFLILFQAAGPGRHPLRTASLFAAAFLGAAFPWLLKNWVLFGAPLYPYLSEPAIPRWLASLADEAHVRSVLGPATPKPLLAAREPFSPVTWLLHPERLTPESEGGAYGANLAFLFLLAALPLIRRRAFAAITLPAALFFGGTLLMNGGRLNLRYLIPVIPLLTIGAASGITTVMRPLKSRTLRLCFVTLIAGAILFPSVSALAGRLRETRALPFAAGLLSREGYRVLSPDPEISAYARMTGKVNSLIPQDGKLLMLLEGRGYGFATPVIQDNVLTNWLFLSQLYSPGLCLRPTGITHVLVGTGTLEYFIRKGLDPDRIVWGTFGDFAALCLELMEATPSYVLFRVASPSEGVGTTSAASPTRASIPLSAPPTEPASSR